MWCFTGCITIAAMLKQMEVAMTMASKVIHISRASLRRRRHRFIVSQRIPRDAGISAQCRFSHLSAADFGASNSV
jgi:hypothetical protein